MTLSLSHFGSNVKGATHAGLGSNLVTKKGFPSSNECLRRGKVCLSRETDLIIVVYEFKYLIAFGEQKMVTPETKNEGISGHV